MRICTLFVPGLTWLDADDGATLAKDLDLPTLAKLAGKGSLEPLAGSASAAWRRLLGAPLTLAANLAKAGGHDDGVWLIADPVNLRVDRDRALLGDVGIMNLSLQESQSLVASLNDFFAEDGLHFHVLEAGRWLVQLPKPSEASFSPLADVIGEDINRHLPKGKRGMLWCRYLNELQMLLYNHPVNDAREARGEPTVNSVWFWGESDSSVVIQSDLQQILSAEGWLATLAAQAQIACDLPPYRFADLSLSTGHSLIHLDVVEAAAQFHDVWGWQQGLQRLETDWLQPALQALQSGQVDCLQIVCHGEAGFSLTIKRSDLWKFWRRPVRLAALQQSGEPA